MTDDECVFCGIGDKIADTFCEVPSKFKRAIGKIHRLHRLRDEDIEISRKEESKEKEKEKQDKEVKTEKYDKCLSKIAGYDDIKAFLTNYFNSQEDLNVLLLGSPATSKTLFLNSIKQKYGRQSLYYDFSNSTGRGFIKQLIKRYHEMNPLNKKKTVYLLLDEVEKIKPVSDLDMLLNLLEENEIHYTKSGINEHIKLNVKVFATANSIERLPKQFLSRFFILQLKEYDLEQFMQIAVKMSDEYLHVKNAKAREEIAMEIAAKIFESNMRDVRQIRDIMKLYNIFHGKKTVDEILEFRSKYLKSEDEEETEDAEYEEDLQDADYYVKGS